MIDVRFFTDVHAASEVSDPVLLTDPVAHNVALAAFDELGRAESEAQIWLVNDDGRPRVLAFRSGAGGSLRLAVMRRPSEGRRPAAALMRPLAEAILDQGHDDVSGINADVEFAAGFAAAWKERTGAPIALEVLQQFYRLDIDDLRPPSTRPEGGARLATADDMDQLRPWAIGFQRDVFGADGGQAEIDEDDLFSQVLWKVQQNEVWMWEADEPVAMTAATRPVGGVSRIQHVYTPPENRRRGLATACVVAVVDERRSRGVDTCVLFADLANPGSNAMYRGLGFQPVQVYLDLSFGSPGRPA